MNPLTEHLEFFRQFRSRFETTGAVAPSSRFLANAMVRPFSRRSGPTRILEVGPGTGAVTKSIVRQLKPGDQFHLVEINEEFANLLRKRFASDPDFAPVAGQAEVHQIPLQEFRPEERFDVVISGLPFNNFPATLVEELIDHCLSLLNPGGEMAFFEYMYVRPMRRLISPGKTRTRLAEIERVLQERFSAHRVQRDWVFINMPPAWVQHLQKECRNGREETPL